MKVRIYFRARDELASTLAFIKANDPAAAERVAERVLKAIESLAAGEFDGPELRLTSGRHVRTWPVPPFRVFYQRMDDTLRVLRIYHHARRPLGK